VIASQLTFGFSYFLLLTICGVAWISIKRPVEKKTFCVLLFLTLWTLQTTPTVSYHVFNTFKQWTADPITNWRKTLLFFHIILAVPSTFLGATLFFEPFRRRHLNYHRWVGKIYVTATLLSAVIVFPLALTNASGPIPRFGFSSLAFLWFVFTLYAYLAIRRKDVRAHRIWMMRSYALTFAFVHVNVTFRFFGVYDWVDNDRMKLAVLKSYVSWLLNLSSVEIYHRLRTRSLARRREERRN
jgi:uncharacterized membrane protein